MKLLKRVTPQLCLLGIICFIAAFGYVKSEIIDVNADAFVNPTVIIDAGHGELVNTTG